MSKPNIQKRTWLVMGGVGLGLTVLWGAATAWQGGGANAGAAGNNTASNREQQTDVVLASINGQRVTEFEIAGLLQSGVDRAIVVDRYINKVIAAEKGRSLYPEDAVAALRAAEREVLSTLYTTRRMEELRASVTDQQVQDFYNKNVLDQNFQLWKVSYYLSGSEDDAAKFLDGLKKNDKDAAAQLKPLVEQGDGYANAASLPYNLGRVVSKMKRGEISEVLRLRNGLLVLRVDDMKQTKKPTLDELKQEIIQALALEKFNEELEAARRKAKVELG
ncbi:peptidyl-prolyl cis-trans isomerase [Limnobacter sp.]|uniref:peptidylprolyl isomerase n=1 Tax=Limnobacter sp. TaxID=2003368 RepID=UPI003512AB27